MAWKDFGKRSPMQARMLREFTRMGLDADVAGEIVSRLPLEMTAAQSRYLPMGLLADRLTIDESEPLDKGGMIAVIGPTGVGKGSEEHTSELQSLMRISYDVFCLKKKNTLTRSE